MVLSKTHIIFVQIIIIKKPETTVPISHVVEKTGMRQ